MFGFVTVNDGIEDAVIERMERCKQLADRAKLHNHKEWYNQLIDEYWEIYDKVYRPCTERDMGW